jgi:hypothetical protein
MNRSLDFTIASELSSVCHARGKRQATGQSCTQRTLHRLCTNALWCALAQKSDVVISRRFTALPALDRSFRVLVGSTHSGCSCPSPL